MIAAEPPEFDQSRFDEELDKVKCEAIYQFAYGLSHELNNPLANISARAGVLLNEIEDPDHRQMLETIIDSAARGSEMLGDLMLIARPPQLQLASVDLVDLGHRIRERGTKWTSLRGLELLVDWQPTGTVRLDQSMLCEIVWALLRNAIEATISVRPIRLSATLQHEQLHVQIDDEGNGLSGEALQHCFDPYYSGREAGRGLGMGLAKAKRLSQIHGGDVKLSNRATGGCRASLWVAVEPVNDERTNST